MRQDIYDLIEIERAYQDEKWGHDFDDTHTPADWWTFVAFYYSKALGSWKLNKAAPHSYDAVALRNGLVKVAAIIVAWIESLDRKAA